jgi:hypothetical protein
MAASVLRMGARISTAMGSIQPIKSPMVSIWLGRVVDKNVEAAKCRLRESDETVDLMLIFTSAGWNAARPRSAAINATVSFPPVSLVSLTTTAIPSLGKSPRDGTAGSFPARAGDDRDLAIQVHS